MANPWFRVWSEMINDPKWRTIARISKQRIGDVVAVYVHMMTCASNATERGRTEGWSDEDVATALDMDTGQVTAVREAMQGRVLDGEYLSGWEKRQPIREDGSAERGKTFRENEKLRNEVESLKKQVSQTQPNAAERNRPLEEIRIDTDTEDKDQTLSVAVAPGEQGDARLRAARKAERDAALLAQFDATWAAYPKRHGTNSKADALEKWAARIREKVTPEVIHAGVLLYAEHCRVNGKLKTSYVMSGARFFGAKKHYADDYELTPDPGEKNGTLNASLGEQNYRVGVGANGEF